MSSQFFFGGTNEKLHDPDPKKASAAKKRADELQTMVKRLGIHYMTRERNIHAKAGNINSVLINSTCEENCDNKVMIGEAKVAK